MFYHIGVRFKILSLLQDAISIGIRIGKFSSGLRLPLKAPQPNKCIQLSPPCYIHMRRGMRVYSNNKLQLSSPSLYLWMPVVQKVHRLCSEDKEISWTQLKEFGVSPGLSWKISSVIWRNSCVHDYLVHLTCFELLSGWVQCCLKLHNQNTFMSPCFNDSRVYIRKLYSNIAETPFSFVFAVFFFETWFLCVSLAVLTLTL